LTLSMFKAHRQQSGTKHVTATLLSSFFVRTSKASHNHSVMTISQVLFNQPTSVEAGSPSRVRLDTGV